MKNKIHIRVSPDDRADIELIKEAYATSMAGAVRAAIRAMVRQIRIRDTSDK